MQTENIRYIVFICYFWEGEMHSLDFQEMGEDSRGRRCPTGKTSENQRKHLRDKEHLSNVRALLSFELYNLHKSQGSNKPNLQDHSLETGGSTDCHVFPPGHFQTLRLLWLRVSCIRFSQVEWLSNCIRTLATHITNPCLLQFHHLWIFCSI